MMPDLKNSASAVDFQFRTVVRQSAKNVSMDSGIMFVGKDKKGECREVHCNCTCIVDRCNLVKAQSFGLRNPAFRL